MTITNPIDPKTGEPLNQAPDFQNPSRYLKGALISYDPEKQKTLQRVAFQYNPVELSRSLKANILQGSQGKDLIRVPTQTVSTTIRLQAVDRMVAQTKKKQLEKAGLGLHAQLAALELLLYPKSSVIEAYHQDLEKGTKGAVPASAHPVLFQWGPQRLLPVRLQSMEIKETLFNIALNPIAADVSLTMEVENIDTSDGMAYQLLQQNLKNLEAVAEVSSKQLDWKKNAGY